MALLATALMCTAFGPGCGQPPAAPTPPSVSRFSISYERSGGLAAAVQRLSIRPGRRGYLSIQRRPGIDPKTVKFRVGAKRVESLRRSLALAEFGTIESPTSGPAICADCFHYAIGYREHEVEFDENTMPDGMSAVVRGIEAVIAAHSH